MVYLPFLTKFKNLTTLQLSLLANGMKHKVTLDEEEKRILSSSKTLKRVVFSDLEYSETEAEEILTVNLRDLIHQIKELY